jgi:phospholipid/cholesterol/gamma-HCH transport system substrate-binding protein
METRANYVVTGAFTLAVIAGVFSFIFWFHNSGSGGERASYRVVFSGSVSGLLAGRCCSTAFASARFPGMVDQPAK